MAKILNMSRGLSCILFASLTLIIVALPARSQGDKTAPKPAPPPEVDPDAASYSTTKKYTPPGAVKSVEIGNFYLKKKKYNGALSRFQEAVQEDSSYAPAYFGLGKVYEEIGLKQKALDAYKKYLDALPSQKAALEAKDAQRAVARLEQEVKAHGPRKHGHASSADGAPRPQ